MNNLNEKLKFECVEGCTISSNGFHCEFYEGEVVSIFFRDYFAAIEKEDGILFDCEIADIQFHCFEVE